MEMGLMVPATSGNEKDGGIPYEWIEMVEKTGEGYGRRKPMNMTDALSSG